MTVTYWIKYKPKGLEVKSDKYCYTSIITIGNIIDYKQAVKGRNGSFLIPLTKPHPLIPKNSINDLRLKETEVVKWLFEKKYIDLVLQEIFNSFSKPIYYQTEVKKPFITREKKPGDIDIFIFQNSDCAIGIECKVIKNTFISNTETKINKINKINDAWEQLEGYRDLGFHQTYLLLIILDDQSQNKAKGQLSRRMDETTILEKEVMQVDNDSGILLLYINQFSEVEFNFQNRVTCELIRKACKLFQPNQLTEKINSINLPT